jgi:5-(hydroxymethyl)furfural/furfural oxidase
MEADYIIVGGGSAGAVVASRLSQRSSNRVILIEAGEDLQEDNAPEPVMDSFAAFAFLNPRFLWKDLTVTTQAVSQNRPPDSPRPSRRYEQARILGGGSSINGQLANRGAPSDYDEWARRGATGWDWQSVLPYFRKLEHDLDFDNELHGQGGPIPIRRIFPEHWAEHAKATAEAFRAIGFDYVEDQNGEFRDGYYPCTISNQYNRRVPTALAYLNGAVRRRQNLEVRTNCTVVRLVFDGKTCTGVVLRDGSGERTLRGREIILSCGAIHTPAQLLRSGLGPAAHLREMGIPVVQHLQGVGQKLMDHPSVSLAAFIKPHARLNGRTRRHILVGLRFSSHLHDAPMGDMAATVSTKSAWHAVGEQIASVNMWVNKTFSEAGEIRLRSPDADASPEVNFNLLQDRRDLERLAASYRRLAKIFDVPAMQGAVSNPFPASFSDRVKAIGEVTPKNAFLTSLLAKMLDGPEFFRKFLIENVINEGPSLNQLLSDDEALEAFLRKTAIGVWHASCSCRMGAADDPWAVTDVHGKVRGVEGLRIVDASLFPTIPSANINLTTIMAAEKISDAVLAGH